MRKGTTGMTTGTTGMTSPKPAQAPTKTHYGPTACYERGRGEPVLLIHGVGICGEIWTPQLDALAETHRIIVPDLLGHGESDLPPPAAGLADYIRQIAELMNALDLPAANIVGHSMGALIALGLAIAHPQRVLRVAALNAVYKRTAQQREAVVRRAQSLGPEGPLADIEVTLERWLGPPAARDPAAAALIEACLARTDPRGYARAYAIFAMSDEAHAGRLEAIRAPALYFTGALDHNSSPEMSAQMARETPQGCAVVLPEARHMMAVTHPEDTNAQLKRFLEVPLHSRGGTQ